MYTIRLPHELTEAKREFYSFYLRRLFQQTGIFVGLSNKYRVLISVSLQ